MTWGSHMEIDIIGECATEKHSRQSEKKRGGAVSFRIKYNCEQNDFWGLPVRDSSNFKSLLGTVLAMLLLLFTL